jgi:hypothetical protein
MLFDELDPKEKSCAKNCWKYRSEIPSGRDSYCRGYKWVEVLIDPNDGEDWYGGK